MFFIQAASVKNSQASEHYRVDYTLLLRYKKKQKRHEV